MNYFKNLVNIKAFLPNEKYVIDIIKFCQLKHTDNWKIWQDDYGNILSIDRKRYHSIKLNQNINLQTVDSKDLYCKANIKKLSSINKYSLIAIKDDIIYLWMLDENNILRLCMYVNDILMENQPVLNSGIRNLKIIIENSKIDSWTKVDSVIEPLGTEEMKSWATSWPPQNDLLILLPDIIKKVL